MSVSHVEVLVEEPSAEAALHLLLPRILGDVATFAIYPHSCKDELLTRLPERLRGYASWLPPDCRIVVIVDRDDDDCSELKRQLEQMARDAGLSTRTSRAQEIQVVNRLAIEELEAWFFGDWEAVRGAYPRVNAHIPQQARYRAPDAIRGGTWEASSGCSRTQGISRPVFGRSRPRAQWRPTWHRSGTPRRASEPSTPH